MTTKTFTKKEITTLTNLKPNQVKYFVEQGLISEVEISSGTGHYRTYNTENLCEFAILEVLSRYGFSVKEMQEVLGLIKAGVTRPKDPTIEHPFPKQNNVQEFTYEGLASIEEITEFEYIVFIFKASKDAPYHCMGYIGFRDNNGNLSVGNESFQYSGDSCILINGSQIIKSVLKGARAISE